MSQAYSEVQVEAIGTSCAGALSYRSAMRRYNGNVIAYEVRAAEDHRAKQDVRRRFGA